MITRASDISHNEIQQLIGKPNPVILEIGANDGLDSYEFMKRFPKARLYCFECDPRAIEQWYKLMGDVEGVTLTEVALDVTAGTKLFHQSSGSPYPDKPDYDWNRSGSLCRPTGHLFYSPWCDFKTSIEVETMRLDDWWWDCADATMKDNFAPNIPDVDFIWCDCQGADLRVLSGAPLTLKKTRYVKVECHKQQLYDGAPREPEMLAFMAERGFKCLGRYADDLLFRNEDMS